MKQHESLLTLAQTYQPQACEWRRHLHRFPETRWQEDASLEWVLEQIRTAKSTFPWQQKTEFSGGLVIDMLVDDKLPWRLFRADIDALPIQEESGLPFSSEHPGLMHACGHDAHSAMLLAAFHAAQSGEVAPKHNVRWVWQRAEENPQTPPVEESGGARLVREGVCDGMEFAHALHIWSDHPAGQFESYPGAMMASSGRIRIELKCQGGHAAMPHLGSNALRIAYEICNALEGFPALVLDPLENVTLEPTILHAGTASNVRPSSAELCFSNRHFLTADATKDYQDQLEKRIRSVVEFYPDARVEVLFTGGHPVTHNSKEDVHQVQTALSEAKQKVKIISPIFAGEDFAYYLQKVPGSLWFLGAHQPTTGSHHTPLFNPSEEVLWRGILFWLVLATTNNVVV